MEMDYSKIENRIIDIVNSILIKNKEKIKKLGLTYSKPKLKQWWNELNKYESEYELYIWKTEDLYEVFEFRIFQNGRPVASINEFEKWIIDNLNELFDTRENDLR